MDTKHIFFTESAKPPKKESKEPSRKVVAQTEEWAEYHLSDLSHNEQIQIIQEVINYATSNIPIDSIHCLNPQSKILLRTIRIKQQGYKTQDIEKTLFDRSRFVDIKTIFEKLRDSDLMCFYCKEPVLLFYAYCRDPKQWTLERVDNQFGHNCDNVEIACLQCNVRRRTMYHERYQMTKQCVIRKMPPS